MTSPGEVDSYNLPIALELLTVAWSQHHPYFSPQIGISLAKKISSQALVGKASYLPFLFSANLRFLTIRDSTFDQMYLDDGMNSFLSLHEQIVSLLPCKPVQLSIFAFQWSPHELQQDKWIRILANGRIGWKCQDSPTVLQKGSLSILLKTIPVQGSAQDYFEKRQTSLQLADPKIEMNLSNIK